MQDGTQDNPQLRDYIREQFQTSTALFVWLNAFIWPLYKLDKQAAAEANAKAQTEFNATAAEQRLKAKLEQQKALAEVRLENSLKAAEARALRKREIQMKTEAVNERFTNLDGSPILTSEVRKAAKNRAGLLEKKSGRVLYFRQSPGTKGGFWLEKDANGQWIEKYENKS